ncbi:Transcriptional regulator, GntR family / Aspartate aminotransferase [Liberibacter crescens BT-1]|uniref:Transcriptional regulator, GntR family / Aspartate aminotransferase n=1 Tax=Liberibacter crescens (strain BT-1) TaxID=1215343 RepID=L0EU02_LIBCB|nr:PLP-dependent aminotransferase family protein [Liberibacter crescens]AGA64128.1 Transcriptional regulator, GntR family / Aspartate aminotransferase [Liberibacter crescens BT-1]AMC12404.1 GntR family transcriptional regulator [Liberibacter crescens]
MLNWEEKFSTRLNRMHSSEIRELLKLLERPDIISFAGGIPDANLLPKEFFKEAYESILSKNGSFALQYSISEGYLPLREFIASEMNEIGISCSAANIIITSGSQQALDYLGKLFLSPGDTAFVRAPTYLGALMAFNAYEPVYSCLSLDQTLYLKSYKDSGKDVRNKMKFAYVSSDFSNPTGETLDLKNRENLINFIDEMDIALIEDGAYQALRFDGEKIPPILALEIKQKGHINKTRVIYTGSFSKTLSPGIRIGWICANIEVIKKIILIKQASDLHVSTINQMAMHYAASYGLEAQLKKIKKVYSHRRDCMLTALSKHMPKSVTWTKPEGGMFIWMNLMEKLNTATLLKQSLESEKVAFVPGSSFFADRSGTNTLRISFSCTEKEIIEEGIERLSRLIRKEEALLDTT